MSGGRLWKVSMGIGRRMRRIPELGQLLVTELRIAIILEYYCGQNRVNVYISLSIPRNLSFKYIGDACEY